MTNIEPGLTRTELDTHVTSADASAQLDAMFDALDPLAADEIADLIAYTTSRAWHVKLRQVIVLPTRQA